MLADLFLLGPCSPRCLVASLPASCRARVVGSLRSTDSCRRCLASFCAKIHASIAFPYPTVRSIRHIIVPFDLCVVFDTMFCLNCLLYSSFCSVRAVRFKFRSMPLLFYSSSWSFRTVCSIHFCSARALVLFEILFYSSSTLSELVFNSIMLSFSFALLPSRLCRTFPSCSLLL